MISLHTRHLRRYRDIARLMMKYGQSDLVRRSGLAGALADEASESDVTTVAERKSSRGTWRSWVPRL